MNILLETQLKQTFGSSFDYTTLDPKVQELLERVEEVYKEHERKKQLLEQALKINRQTEKKLDLEHRFNQMLFDYQENVVVVTSKSKGLLEANRRFYEVFGFKDRSDFQSQYEHIGELFIDREGFISLLPEGHWADKVLAEPDKHHKVLMPDRDGNERIFTISLNRIAFDKEHYMIMSFTDITELERAREDAEASEKLKSQFMANMSHEIRTPMNGIISFANLLQKSELDSKQKQYAGHISSAAQNLLSIVNDILDFSKIQNGYLKLDPIAVNPFSEIRNAIAIFNLQIKEKNISLNLDIDTSIHQCLMMDVLRITQIMSNLVSNAIKFTPQNGTIDVEVKHISYHDDYEKILFSVRDNGIGIPNNRLEAIFESFIQADCSTTRNYGGTGLGLSISASLCRLMDSELHVESQEGEGSRFYFEVNLKTCPLHAVSHVSKEDSQERYKAKRIELKVLVAEDQEMNRIVIRELFKTYGVSPEFALDGKEAVEKVMRQNYDLILMDISMPVMGGVEATKILRKNNIKIPIIAFTANTLEYNDENYLHYGMNDFLTKPINIKNLETILLRYAPVDCLDRTNCDIETVVDILLNVKNEMQLSSSVIVHLFETFIENSMSAMNFLSKAIGKGEKIVIMKQAHAIRGTALSLGFEMIGAVCRELEYGIKEDRDIEIDVYVLELKYYIDYLVRHKEEIINMFLA